MLTHDEKHVMMHTLGWVDISTHYLDPWKGGYRNHFVAGPDHVDWATLQNLCDRGLMYVRCQPSSLLSGMTMFAVDGPGRELLVSEYLQERSAKWPQL